MREMRENSCNGWPSPMTDACDRPDFDWVLPNLAIGGRLSPTDAAWLADLHGIRRVVDLRDGEEDDLELMNQHGIALLRLPTQDLEPVTQEMLWTGVEWVAEGLAKEE